MGDNPPWGDIFIYNGAFGRTDCSKTGNYQDYNCVKAGTFVRAILIYWKRIDISMGSERLMDNLGWMWNKNEWWR